MIEIKEKTDCCGCHACYNICPKNAIEMIEDEKGFKYPKINKEKCIECNLCIKVCPIINKKVMENNIMAYACYNKNEEELKHSSSGGMFILLAKEILKRNGVVFGAYLDKNYNVQHGYIENKKDIKIFMGSKYVQSNIGETYRNVKYFLEKERYVLYTGTPCQIEGLKTYLGKDYDKLYTQDIICHGVPSPLVWEKYKEYRKNMDKNNPIKINFRDKNNGWNDFSMSFIYKNDKYIASHNDDLFMNAFLKNTILRDSCYKCNFKNKYRISDITLADYWGVNEVEPQMMNDSGVSLVLVNSSKGRELFRLIKNNIIYKETNLDEAIKYNPSFSNSSKMDKNRDKFFKNINKIDFAELVKKYTSKSSIYKQIINKCKKIIKTIIKK